ASRSAARTRPSWPRMKSWPGSPRPSPSCPESPGFRTKGLSVALSQISTSAVKLRYSRSANSGGGSVKQRVQWRLYVDESGSFSTTGDPGGTVVLAGVLLRERDGTQLSTQLRALTHRYFPGLPTPLHAAHLFAPAFHLLHRTSLPTVGRMSGLVDG